MSTTPDELYPSFLYEIEAWPHPHIYLPFLWYLYFHDIFAVLSLVFLIEFAENATFLIFRSYIVFGEEGLEPRANSIVADPLNGIIGIILAIYFTRLFESPAIFPKPWTTTQYKRKKLYVLLNLIGLVIYGVPSIPLKWNYPDTLDVCNFNGVYFFFISGIVAISFLYFVNSRKQFYQFLISGQVYRKFKSTTESKLSSVTTSTPTADVLTTETPSKEFDEKTICQVEKQFRFPARTRFHLLFGGFLLTHATTIVLFVCPWLPGWYVALVTVGMMYLAYTIAWLILDAVYRRRTGQKFTLMNWINAFRPKPKQLTVITPTETRTASRVAETVD